MRLTANIFQMNQIDEDEADDEEMGVAETYADYWPSKCELNITKKCFD